MHFTKTYTILFPFSAITLCMMIVSPNVMSSELKNIEPNFKRYSLGRFYIKVPGLMSLVNEHYVLAYAEVEEIKWNEIKNRNREAEKYWSDLIANIKSTEAPIGIGSSLIQIDELGTEVFKKGVLYYPSRARKRRVKYSLLVNKEGVGLLLSIVGSKEYVEAIKKGINEIEATYRTNDYSNEKGAKYVLESGYFNYAFNGKEETYFKFKDEQLNLQLEIETETVKKIEKTNIIENLSAALASNFAPGVSVDKIRVGERTVADMKGEEVVMRGKEGNHSELSFTWHFNGKKNSAISPEITIEMESPDENLEEKLAVWDSVLDSMQVIPQ